MNRALLCLLLCFLAGCYGRGSREQQQLANEIAAQSPGDMSLKSIAGDQWSRVCFFGPYTPSRRSSVVLGFDWDVTKLTDIEVNEGMNVVVFATEGKVVEFVELGRNRADFWKLSGKCFPRNDASFYLDSNNRSYLHK